MGKQSRISSGKKRVRLLFYGFIALIVGIIVGSVVSPYKSCGYLDFFCSPQLKGSSELIGDYIGPVFLIVAGTLAIIVWALSQSEGVRTSVRAWGQRQRHPKEKKYNLEDDDDDDDRFS